MHPGMPLYSELSFSVLEKSELHVIEEHFFDVEHD